MKKTGLKFASAALAVLLGNMATAVATEGKIEKPDWAGNKLGYEALGPDYVDVDYGPMKVSEKTAMSLFKKITLGKSGLPAMISVRDTKVISGPVKLILEGEKGPINYSPSGCKLTQTGKSAAEGIAKFDAGRVEVEIKSQFEFDFTVRYQITLTPKSPVTLKVVSLVFPMNLEGEKICHHWAEAPNKPESGLDAQRRRIFKTIKEGDYDMIAPGFSPLFWVGNTNYGLGWDFESAKGWNPVKGSELMFDPGANTMTINFISKTTTLDKPVTYKFFLTPTPLKNMPKNWRTWNYAWRGSPNQKFDHTLINQLIYWSSAFRPLLSGGEVFNNQWVRSPDFLKNAATEDNGMNKAAYFCPQLFTAKISWKSADGKNYLLEDKYLEMLCEKYYRSPGGKGGGYSGKVADILADFICFKNIEECNKVLGANAFPGSKLKGKGITYDVVAAPEMADHMVWAVNTFVNKYGVGGIYYDGISPVWNYRDWSAWTDTYGGWKDSDGALRPSYHYEWQRQLLKRNRYVVKKAAPNEMIWAHQSGVRSTSTLSLCDGIIPGETLFYGYRELEQRDASANGDFYYAHIVGDIDNLKGEFFYRQWGVPHMLLPEVRGKDGKTFPNPRPTRTMLAYFLHMDTLYWPTMCNTEEIFKWYKIRNAYGMADTNEEIIEFVPYWENKIFIPSNKNVKVSYYDKVKQQELYTSYDIRKKYLVIVSNLQFGDSEFTISLPAKLQKAKICEMQTNKEVTADNGKFPCSLAAYDFAIYEITGELDEGKGTW